VNISGVGGSDWFSSVKNKDDRQKVPGNIVSMLATDADIDPASQVPAVDPISAATKQFQDYMDKTPEQRMQEAWLHSHGITPEEFAAMSPAEKKALTDQMREEMEEKMKQQQANARPGSIADLLV